MGRKKSTKTNKNIAHKIEAVLLTLSLTATGTVCVYKLVSKTKLEEEPIIGSMVVTNDDNFNNFDEFYLNNDIKDLEYQEVLDNIKNNNVEQKKAEALYYAILSNDSLTTDEKNKLSNYIQYFIDNKYINHNHVYDKLLKFKITTEDPSLLDYGIGATYNDDNSITFATPEEREYSLSHEIFHCIENENLSYEDYAWFIEGYVCLLNYEYFNMEYDGNNMKSNFIRCLCEIVEPDVLFMVSASGDINPLVNALNEKGIDNEKIEKLFDLCKEYNLMDALGEQNLKEICTEIVVCFIDMYNTIYNNPDYVSDSFFHSLLKIKEETSDIYDYYYFNSNKIKNNNEKQYNITQQVMNTILEKATMSYF